MGLCLSDGTKKKKQKEQSSHIDQTSKLNNKEREYLNLIYTDLANRSTKKKLNSHNFALFFELTGLWGNKLFRYFATSGQDQITVSQFTNGMIKIVQAPFDEKAKILFNFIKGPTDEGIRYKQFLKMLYHYSKKQLKQIMTSDGVFIHEAIIPETKTLQTQKMNSLKQSGIVKLELTPSIQKIQLNNQNHFRKAYQKIYNDYQDPGTLLQFQTQKITYQVSYCNMSNLTKQYASHIFHKYNINQQREAMNQYQFHDYVKGNMKLFDSYYATFHQNLWGFKNGQPRYIQYIQKQTNVTLTQGISTQQCHMMLVGNTLVLCSSADKKQNVIRMINLTGVAISQGSQTQMVVKDQPDANFMCIIQFASNLQTNQWKSQLKQYSNNYFQSKYQVLQAIGTGKFSVVYKCKQKSTGKQYALKIIQLQKLTQRQLSTIQNQTEITKILKSPNFIKQIDTIFTKKTIYMVSEYIYGEDLFQYVKKKKRLSQSQAAFLLGQIIQATLHLHNLEIIHRDLKPENIMVAYKKVQNNTMTSLLSQDNSSPNKIRKPKPQTIKLIDFGFANYFSVLQQRNDEVPIGTLNYMAPQILLGEKPTYQNDTFSIGSIMYYMLRGKYPFQSTNPQGTAILTVKGDYSLNDTVWQQVSDQAKQLIQMFLKTDPEERITLKQALNHPWFKSVNNYVP